MITFYVLESAKLSVVNKSTDDSQVKLDDDSADLNLAIVDVPYNSYFTSVYQPKERCGHSMIRIGDCVYLWSGFQLSLPSVHSTDHKTLISSCIEVFYLQSGVWERANTFGQPPLGVIDYAAVSIGDMIFYFGGDCNHIGDCCHNSLYGLDVTTLKWKEFYVTNSQEGESGYPSRKRGSGIVKVEFNGEPYLVVVGGENTDNTPHHSGGMCSQSMKLFQAICEIHYFRLLTSKYLNMVNPYVPYVSI